MENKKVSLIVTVLTTVFITGFSLFFMFSKKEKFSEYENRYLEKFPEYSFSDLKNGKYIPKIETYLTDHFPIRNTYMGIKTSYQKLMGIRKINGVYLGQNEYLMEDVNDQLKKDDLIKTLNKFYKNNNVKMSLMLVPTSIAINQDKLPVFANKFDQESLLKYIYEKIEFDSINVYDTLNKQNKGNQMYYRLDHHWTTLGAYYAYVEFAKNNNFNYLKLSNFNIEKVTDDFNGTLFSKANEYSFKPDNMEVFKLKDSSYSVNYVTASKKSDSLYEEKYLETKDKYSYFLDNNHALIEITNNNIKNGQEIVIIKDSYANSFIPFLVNHYEKVHVIDPRFFTDSISDYLEEKNIDEVLFLYNVNSIDANVGIYGIK